MHLWIIVNTDIISSKQYIVNVLCSKCPITCSVLRHKIRCNVNVIIIVNLLTKAL